MAKIVGLAMVKNESDIIEAFVRHNLLYLDTMHIIDNDSIDGTKEILVAMQKEGLPITIYDDPGFGNFHSERLTKLFHKVIPIEKPDYTFWLDADEFLLVESRAKLEANLAMIPIGQVGLIQWKTFIPEPTKEPKQSIDPLRDIQYRRISEKGVYCHKSIATSKLYNPSLVISQGGHRMLDASGREIPQTSMPDIWLGHFPIRSIEQLTMKAVVGWLAQVKRNKIQNTPGDWFQIHKLYDKIVYGGGVKQEDITDYTLQYAANPVPNWTWPKDVVLDPATPNYTDLKYEHLIKYGALSKIVWTFERWIS